MSSPEALYSESTLATADGVTLHLKTWRPATGKPRGHVLILHGYMEHGGRYRDVAHTLCAAGLAATAPDVRGHGQSSGQRGRVDRFEDYLDDLALMLETLTPNNRFILGHSHGGLIALDFVVQRKPALRGLVVTNPFLAQTVPAAGIKLWVGIQAGKHLPWLSLPGGLDPAGVSHDPAIVDAYKRDPLNFTMANAAWFRELGIAQKRVRGYTEVDVPLLYVRSDADPIVLPAANEALSARLQSPDKTVIVRQGEYHEVLNEVNRAELQRTVAAWVLQRCG